MSANPETVLRPLEIKPWPERAEVVIEEWLAQLRADPEIMRAIGFGRQVDVTLYADKCRASKPPDHAVRGQSRR